MSEHKFPDRYSLWGESDIYLDYPRVVMVVNVEEFAWCKDAPNCEYPGHNHVIVYQGIGFISHNDGKNEILKIAPWELRKLPVPFFLVEYKPLREIFTQYEIVMKI